MKRIYIIIFLATFLLAATNNIFAEDYYQWTDEKGVVHATDNPDKVPPRYKNSLKVVREKDTGTKATLNNYKKLAKRNQQTIIVVAVSLLGLLILYKLFKSLKNRSSVKSKNKYDEIIKKSGIDTMNIPQFKNYVKNVLSAKGYHVKVFEGDLDFGVDYIADKGSMNYLVKIVADNMTTSKMVVNDILRDTSKYGCNAAMVISKNYFTEDALEFSKSSPSELIDRTTLGKWIKDTKLYS